MVEKNDKNENEKDFIGCGHIKFNLNSASLGINDNLVKINNINGNLVDNSILQYDEFNDSLIDHSIVYKAGGIGELSNLSPIAINDAIFNVNEDNLFLNTSELTTGIDINKGIFETEYPLTFIEDTNIIKQDNNIFDNIQITNGILSLDQSSIVNAGLSIDDKYSDNLLFIKGGHVEPSPTQRLNNGSIDYLALSSNHNVELNTSFLGPTIIGDGIISITDATKNVLSDLEWDKIGSSYDLDLLEKTKIQDNFLDLSSSYLNLYAEPRNLESLIGLPSTLAELTPEEYLNESLLLRSTYSPEKVIEDRAVKEHLGENSILIERLLRIDPNLNNIYVGALEALRSENIDKIRHYSTSLRELFTHVLHMLSPDDKFTSWSSDRAHFINGRPTRKARLLYITRKINNNKFSKFIDADIKATLEFINIFQEGTHKVVPSFSDSQLSIMKTKMESTLIFLIESALTT